MDVSHLFYCTDSLEKALNADEASAFPNCTIFSGAATTTSGSQNSLSTSGKKKIIIATLPRSVYGVAAFLHLFSFSLAVL